MQLKQGEELVKAKKGRAVDSNEAAGAVRSPGVAPFNGPQLAGTPHDFNKWC